MSKLNLIQLSKEEITKAEAQKARGGATICSCPCICSCICFDLPSNLTLFDTQSQTKIDERYYVQG